MISDQLVELLQRCEQSDESALEELYKHCSRQLYGVLTRILRNEALAEEALQDVFVKIWRKAGTYKRESGSPITWMISIARHQALDQLRRRSSREANESADEIGAIESMVDASKPMHEMSADAKLLMLCLDKLPEQARSCIIRAYCEGYSHEELAGQFDSPIGTVKSWIRRGLISLRKCIDEHS